jgi:hypothetical protein
MVLIRILLTSADHIDLLRCKIIESPISLVDSYSERLAMTPVVVLSELRNRDDLLVGPDCIPEAVSLSAGRWKAAKSWSAYAGSPMT